MLKEKIQLEFPIKASTNMLYNYISTPSGLSEWFADDVNSRGEKYVFFWDGEEEEALLLKNKANKFVRYKWLNDEETDYYFEMAIQEDDITKDVSLLVTDFAVEDDLEETKMLWENQIVSLKHTIGA